MSQAGRYIAGTGAAPIETVTGNAGGPVGPDGAGNINILGGNNITTTGNPGTNTLTIDLDGNVADTFNGDVGSAIPVLGIIGFAGGNNIATSAAGAVVTINVDGTTNHSLLVGNASGSINSLGVATNGQLPIGSTGTDPVLATLTAGSGISILNGAGSITISASGSLSWNEITVIGPTSMSVNNGYIANNALQVVLTLPAVAALGSSIRVTGKGAGGWQIAQNGGQTIYFGTQATTTGAAGMLVSTQVRDTVELVCVTANNDWNVLSSIGNITVV